MGKSKTDEAVAFDLTLNVNFTLDITQADIQSIEAAIAEGDIEAESVEDYLTNLVIDDIENGYNNSIWIPETDGEMRVWTTYADRIQGKNADRIK